MAADNATLLFVEAAKLANDKFYIDAAAKFEQISSIYPGHELADDALFNAGMCYFHLNSFEHAIALFNQVIEQYPDSEIHEFEGGTSFGKTTARCHYAMLNCYLGMANYDEAQKHAAALEAFPDAYEITPLGEKYTYIRLAQKALDSFKKFNV